ncbi:lasso peptide biosynthesis B2 protein [Leptothoe sp. EHU-05/26/07-4]
MKQLNNLLRLSGVERRVLLYACLLLNGIRLALWLLPFNMVRQRISRLASVWVCHNLTSPVSVGKIVWSVDIASRYTPGGAMCLVRALTTQLLLTRYGYKHQLHIGVLKGENNSFAAHAWIEFQGRVIVGGLPNLSQFQKLSAVGTE